MFDSHCHPTDIEDPYEVVQLAVGAGVDSLLACGYNSESNRAVVELRRRIPGLPIALGIHPWFSDETTDGLPSLIELEAPSAIGECGLDFAAEETLPAREVQFRVFEFQLELAQKFVKPVTVHSRRAVTSVLDVIAGFQGVGGIMHAFGGSYEQAKVFVERGWLIGIGGAVTRSGAKRVHNLARRLPIEGIVLETDAPAIGIEGVSPPHIRPAHLPQVAKAVAGLRGIDLEELVLATDANVRRLLGLNALVPTV